jgi:hypothetical protein
MPTAARKPGTFPPGHQGPRRVRGVPNRIHSNLKQAIIDAAVAHGSDRQGVGGLTGYCFFLASQHPRAFAGLLGKLLPLQIDGHLTSTVARINVVSVPVDRYLAADDAANSLQPPVVKGVFEPAETGHSLSGDSTRADS